MVRACCVEHHAFHAEDPIGISNTATPGRRNFHPIPINFLNQKGRRPRSSMMTWIQFLGMWTERGTPSFLGGNLWAALRRQFWMLLDVRVASELCEIYTKSPHRSHSWRTHFPIYTCLYYSSNCTGHYILFI